MSNRPRYAQEGFSYGFQEEGAKYFDKHEKTGALSEIKDGYISSQTPLNGMGEEVAHIKDDGYGGFYDDDETYSTYVYKKPKQEQVETPAPAVETPAPEAPAEPKEEKGPVEYSPEMSEAKERVNNYKTMIDGNEGSTFDGANVINTPQKDPQAQADKYKLNLINKGMV